MIEIPTTCTNMNEKVANLLIKRSKNQLDNKELYDFVDKIKKFITTKCFLLLNPAQISTLKDSLDETNAKKAYHSINDIYQTFQDEYNDGDEFTKEFLNTLGFLNVLDWYAYNKNIDEKSL